jgi:plastocyanin
MNFLTGWLLAAAAIAAIACSSSTGPSNGGGGGGGGGAVGTVTVGNIFFQSGHNGTKNPAVDTVAVGTTVTWTWMSGATSHSVQSEGSPSFTSSAIQAGNGTTYSLAFTSPGTYAYDCAVHGEAMTGRIVVQ